MAPDVTVAETLHRMRGERIGTLVVSEDKTSIAGIISERGVIDAIVDRGIEVGGKMGDHAGGGLAPGPGS